MWADDLTAAYFLPEGTDAGSYVGWDGTAWVESTSIALPIGAARSIGMTSTAATAGYALTIQGQTTTKAAAAGGAIIIDTGTPGAGGNAGIMLLRRGGVDAIYLGTVQTRVHAPSGGTLVLTDGAGDTLVNVGASGELGFFGVAGASQPVLSAGGATLADLLSALEDLGLIFLNP